MRRFIADAVHNGLEWRLLAVDIFYSQLTMCFYVVRTGLEGRVTRVADRGSFVRADAILLRAQGQVSIPVNNYECIASLSLCSLCVYVCLYVLCKDNNGRGRYLSAQAAGWSELDWSSIGMKVSTDAGADISDDLARNLKGL